MKQYVDNSGIRLVGKAWEIRHQLRKLSGKQPDSGKRLSEYIRRSAPKE